MSEKIWHVWISGSQQGPFSVEELKRMKEITPDTWAWREGMTSWMPIRTIPELKELFEEENPQPLIEEVKTPALPEEEGVIALPDAQPPWLFLLLLLLVMVIYAFIAFSRS